MRGLAIAFVLLATPALAQTTPAPRPEPAAAPEAAAPVPQAASDTVPLPLRNERASGPRRGCMSVTPTS